MDAKTKSNRSESDNQLIVEDDMVLKIEERVRSFHMIK